MVVGNRFGYLLDSVPYVLFGWGSHSVVWFGLLVGAGPVILVELPSSAESYVWLLALDLVARFVATPKFRLAGVSRLAVGVRFVGWWLS